MVACCLQVLVCVPSLGPVGAVYSLSFSLFSRKSNGCWPTQQWREPSHIRQNMDMGLDDTSTWLTLTREGATGVGLAGSHSRSVPRVLFVSLTTKSYAGNSGLRLENAWPALNCIIVNGLGGARRCALGSGQDRKRKIRVAMGIQASVRRWPAPQSAS